MDKNSASPTVFVVPPNQAIKCPIHFGVFVDPCCAPCGCTFCRRCIEEVIDTSAECPIHSVPLKKEQLRANANAKAVVDDLLIYCKGGLQKNTNGDWVPCPSGGCNMWITLGKRRDHESTCAHAKAHKDNSEPIPVSAVAPAPLNNQGIVSCPHSVHGCLFVGHSQEALQAHQALCGYVHMINHIRALTDQIGARDREILRLNAVLAQETRSREFHLPEAAREILSSVSSKLEKLDENSQHVLEEARSTLFKTRSALQNSSAFQNSLTALSSIKQAVEQAQMEILAKFQELELSSKFSSLINTHKDRPQSSEAGPADDYVINNAQSEEPVEAAENAPAAVDPAVENEVQPNQELPDLVENEENYDDVDEEIKAFLIVSKDLYKREQEMKAAEEAQIQQAMRLSLLDAAAKSSKQ